MINMCDLCRYYYSLTHSLTLIPDSRDLGTREGGEGEREREKKSHKRKERNSDSSNKQRTSF